LNNNYEFYQGATLGDYDLRGFRNQRFRNQSFFKVATFDMP
jgi:hypothetical protein